MSHIGPFLFLRLRTILAAAALLPFALREWQASPPSSPTVRLFALLGGMVFFTAGALQQVGIVTATVDQHQLPHGALCGGDTCGLWLKLAP